MRTNATVLVLSLAVLAAGCGGGYAEAESGPAPSVSAATLDPVGRYDFTASLGGETRTGTIEIARTANGYGGSATLEGESHAAVIDSVRVTGNHMVINLTVPGDPIVFELNFTGAAFTGFILAGGDVVDVFGAKRED